MNPVAEEIIRQNSSLVYLDKALATGALIKEKHSDFVVNEELAYEASGIGEHLYIRFRRSDWNTERIASKMAQILSLDKHDYGYAGMKDRHAIVEQSLSFKLPEDRFSLEEIRQRLSDHAPELTILSMARHNNKLKRGHIKRNSFTIIVRNLNTAIEALQERANTIQQNGCANYYGPQRFGIQYDNIRIGFEVLKGFKRIKSAHKRDLYSSAIQSALFNIFLDRRIQIKESLLLGDVLKKNDTGGLFINEDLVLNQERLKSGELTVCGPMFGYKMMPTENESHEVEMALLEEFHLGINKFKRMKVSGTRRPLFIYPEKINIVQVDETSYEFSFSLPKGTYATTLLRHFFEFNSQTVPLEK